MPLEELFNNKLKDLVGAGWYSENSLITPLLKEKVLLLEKAIKRNRISLNNLEIKKLLNLYFECLILGQASNRFSDLKLLGNNKYIRGKFKTNPLQLAEWFFQLQIQGFYQTKETPLKELALCDLYKNNSCDFEIKIDKRKSTLIECKKLNIGFGKSDTYLKEDEILLKIQTSTIPGAAKQFDSIKKQSDSKIFCTCLFIDISRYKENSKKLIPDNSRIDTKSYGFAEEDIEKIICSLKKYDNKGIDKIYLCWNNYLIIDKLPRAVTCSTKEISYTEMTNEKPYEGWTLEIHPLNKLIGINEVRLSKIARSLGWIITSYNNLSNPQSFIKP